MHPEPSCVGLRRSANTRTECSESRCEAELRGLAFPSRAWERVRRASLALVPAALVLAGVASVALADETRLTDDGRVKSDPVFVDRNELIYVVESRPTQLRLMRLKLSDGKSEPLHLDQTKTEFEPALSLDGKRIAFVQSRGNLSLGMIIREFPAGREFDIKPEGGFAGYRSPAFTADGKRLLYSFATDGRQAIWSSDISGNDRKILIDGSGVSNWPCASRDGKRIVFSSTRDGDFEIYSAAADGSDIRRLTTSPGQDIRPRFSPDGKRIAFVSTRDGNYEVYVMAADGSGVVRVTKHAERDDYPTWTPDGKALVVVSERKGAFDLYRVAIVE